jgi:hypothetical protein
MELKIFAPKIGKFIKLFMVNNDFIFLVLCLFFFFNFKIFFNLFYFFNLMLIKYLKDYISNFIYLFQSIFLINNLKV